MVAEVTAMSGSPARVSEPGITMVRPAMAPDSTVTSKSTLPEAAAAGIMMFPGVLKVASVLVTVPVAVPGMTDTSSSKRATLVTSAVRVTVCAPVIPVERTFGEARSTMVAVSSSSVSPMTVAVRPW